MQNLYMMAALIKEQQMRKMAIEIIAQKIDVEQAMAQYNVATNEAVLLKVEALKEEYKRAVSKNQSGAIDFGMMAA